MKEHTIARRVGYHVYMRDGLYFLDIHKEIIHSYATLDSVREALYYMGYIQSKTSEL